MFVHLIIMRRMKRKSAFKEAMKITTKKKTCQEMKNKDKTESDAVVAVYDLQAVMQIPKGDISVFLLQAEAGCFKFYYLQC